MVELQCQEDDTARSKEHNAKNAFLCLPKEILEQVFTVYASDYHEAVRRDALSAQPLRTEVWEKRHERLTGSHSEETEKRGSADAVLTPSLLPLREQIALEIPWWTFVARVSVKLRALIEPLKRTRDWAYFHRYLEYDNHDHEFGPHLNWWCDIAELHLGAVEEPDRDETSVARALLEGAPTMRELELSIDHEQVRKHLGKMASWLSKGTRFPELRYLALHDYCSEPHRLSDKEFHSSAIGKLVQLCPRISHLRLTHIVPLAFDSASLTRLALMRVPDMAPVAAKVHQVLKRLPQLQMCELGGVEEVFPIGPAIDFESLPVVELRHLRVLRTDQLPHMTSALLSWLRLPDAAYLDVCLPVKRGGTAAAEEFRAKVLGVLGRIPARSEATLCFDLADGRVRHLSVRRTVDGRHSSEWDAELPAELRLTFTGWFNRSALLHAISSLGFGGCIIKCSARGAEGFPAMLEEEANEFLAYDSGARKIVVDFPLEALIVAEDRRQNDTPAYDLLRFCKAHARAKRFLSVITTDPGISLAQAKRFLPVVRSLHVGGEEITEAWIAARSH